MNCLRLLWCVCIISTHISYAEPSPFSTYAQRQKECYEARWKERDDFFASQNFDIVLQEHADDPAYIAQEFAALSFAFILHRERSVDLVVVIEILKQYHDHQKSRPDCASGPIKFIQEKLQECGDAEYFFRPYRPIIQEARELFVDRPDIIKNLELLQERC